MNSRSCRWLIVSALLITASGARTQQSAPPASDQKQEQTVPLSTLTAQCSHPPALDEKSIAAFKQRAASGDAAAQCGLGRMYAQGQGVPQDYTQAAAWCRKAAEQGNAHAQGMLGAFYDTGGHGVPQDFTQAAAWYRKAAEQGDAGGQFGLGLFYYHGDGVPQNYAQAASWVRKAAEQGVAGAQYFLGDLYRQGRGVPQDYTQAAVWCRKAAEQGNAHAQGMLGYLYAKGQGMPQDYAESYFWLNLAAAGKQDASDMEQVAKLRNAIASHLTPADLSRVQERARKWFEAHQAKPQ